MLMRDGNWVLALLSEHQEIIGGSTVAERTILAYLLVREALGHGPIADAERLFPDVVAGNIAEAEFLVQTDDVAREVDQITANVGTVARHVHAMHPCQPARQRDPVKLFDEEFVV